MKNTNLPSKKEWDNIIDEAFSSKQEHIFSAGYEAKKDAMMRGITMKRKNVDKKSHGTDRRLVLSVAAAAALFAIVPAGIFIADHKGNGTTAPMTNMSDAEQETSISEEEQRKLEEEQLEEEQRKIEEENRKIQEEISRQQEELKKLDRSAIEPMQLEFTYVPEGLVYNEDGPYGGKYHSETGGGMSKELYVAEEDAQFTTYNFRWDSEEYDLDGKHVIIRYACSKDEIKYDINYSRFIFVKFNNTPYVGILHITDNYSDEEVRKVCEGMSLVPCEEYTASVWEDEIADSWYTETSDSDNDVAELVDYGGYSVDRYGAVVFGLCDELMTDARRIAGAQALFQNACENEWKFRGCPYAFDSETYIENEQGTRFNLITDPNIKSIDDIRRDYRRFFSAERPDSLNDIYMEKDGKVYGNIYAGQRGANISYRMSEIISLDSKTENTMYFTVRNYYNDGTGGENTTVDDVFSIRKEEGDRWHVETFNLPY